MRRVLAVLISVLTAVWPLLLPQPVSANPCSVNTMAEGASVYAKAGHYINQAGDLIADNSGYAGGGQATGGTGGNAYGGTGEGALALNVNVQKAKGGYADATQFGLNAQDTENKAKNNSYANGGSATGGNPNSSNVGTTTATGATGGSGGSGGSGTGGSASSGPGGAGGDATNQGIDQGVADGNGTGTGGTAYGTNVPVNANIAVDDSWIKDPGDTLTAGNDASGPGVGIGGTGGFAGDHTGGAGGSSSATGGAGTGGAGGAGGSAANAAATSQFSVAKGGNADGGDGGSVWNKASQNNEQSVSNDDNTAIAKGGTNNLTSTNTASGGTGGAATGGAGAGGSATGGLTAERTVGSNTKSVGDIDAVQTKVEVGGATGDPCKQIIKNSTGVLAINGVNDIKGSVMQNAATQLGNAANTNVNMSDLSKNLNLNLGEPYEPMKAYGGAPNININPNNNQNTNIISF